MNGIWFWFFFNGMSIIAGYLMLKPSPEKNGSGTI